MGAFHTLDIESNRDIRIEKADGWDSIAISRVEESCVPGRGAEVGAVVCGEGTAAFSLALPTHDGDHASFIRVHPQEGIGIGSVAARESS